MIIKTKNAFQLMKGEYLDIDGFVIIEDVGMPYPDINVVEVTYRDFDNKACIHYFWEMDEVRYK